MNSRSTTLNTPAPSQQLARDAPSRAKFRPFVFMSAIALSFTIGGGLTTALLGASANAPTSGGLPANAMTSAQLADVSARPHLYPNVTPAQARAELDARAGRPYQGPAIPTMGTAPRATAPIDMPTYDQVP